MSSLREAKDGLVKSANAVTIVSLTVIAGIMTVFSGMFFGFDLMASFFGWGQKMSQEVSLPYQEVLAVILTATPSLIQLAYVAMKMAGLPFANNKRFRTLYYMSAGMDTFLDTAQMWTGSVASLGVSLFLAVCVFLFLSEYLFIFSLSVFISLVHKMKNDDGLLDVAWEQATTGGEQSRGQQRGQSRGRQN